jgi:predicted DNA-binding transcriptional regulator YafY
MTAAQLARELEVSERTIHRDVEALAEAGVPIYAERGPHGGVRLVEGYRTRLTGLTTEEAHALFLSGLPGPAAELGLGTVVAAARLKVLAALPPELRTRAARLSERFHLDAPGWFRPAEAVPHLATLAEAVWESRRAEIDYERGDRRVTRLLEPFGLVLKGGVWYLVGQAEQQIRTYRVSRVAGARLYEDRFERPADFDLAGFWAEASSAYERATPRIELTLRVRPERVPWLLDAIADRPLASVERLDTPDADGWPHLRLQLPWPDEAASTILPLGPDAEVLEPQALRDEIAGLARAVLGRYAAVPA